MGSLGTTGLINILVSLVSILVSWWALQVFKFDLFVKRQTSAQAKVLQILLSIALGHEVAKFFMDYLGWSLMLKELL
jgi:uncharacterized integral membrane protein (TIGR02327 family)